MKKLLNWSGNYSLNTLWDVISYCMELYLTELSDAGSILTIRRFFGQNRL